MREAQFSIHYHISASNDIVIMEIIHFDEFSESAFMEVEMVLE